MKRSVDEITGSKRMRRNRRFDWTRRMVRENTVLPDDLIWPIFLIEGSNLGRADSSNAGGQPPDGRQSRRGCKNGI